MIVDRRHLLAEVLALVFTRVALRTAAGQEGSLYPFADDKGRQVYNYRLPADLSTEGLPGIVWTGASSPDAVLVEFFDYNCPYCRTAAPDLDALLARTPGLRLGLVNNPILSAGSVQAAAVQQAILRTHGPARAYAFHKRVLAEHGSVDGPSALRIAADLGLDAKALEATGDLPQVRDVIARQRHLAQALGFQATPSFMLNATGILGYPGPAAMARVIAAVKRCDKLVCTTG